MATVPLCDFANASRRTGRGGFSPQRHRGHREDKTSRENNCDFMSVIISFSLLVFSVLSVTLWLVLFPTMGVADGGHRREDAVPGLRLHHGRVGEHAAVPADVLEFLGRVAVAVAHP